MILNERIKRSYDRHAISYDAGTELQRSLADKLIKVALDDNVKFSKVLDVGCGTGYLLEKMGTVPKRWDSPHFLTTHFVGCDISMGMLKCAKNKLGGLYVQSDASILPFSDFAFDLVVSNAAYQWVFGLKAAFREVKRVLKPCGKFYFVVFNNNTLRELQDVCRTINIASSNFPDKNKLSASLREAGFKIYSIEIYTCKKYYKDLQALLVALKNIGSTSVENKNIKGLAWRKILNEANKLYVKKFGDKNGIPATYEAFIVKAENA